MRIVVIGVGNVLMGDDGFGVRVVEELRKRDLPECVEVYDCATLGLQILNYMENRDFCVVIDTVRSGKEPGEIQILDLNECKSKISLSSLHDLGLVEAYNIGKMIYNLPKRIVVVGVEPERIEFGLGLSKRVESAIPKAVEIVIEIVRDLLTTQRRSWRSLHRSDSNSDLDPTDRRTSKP
jgi:hydrogenase maturation protease